MSIAFNFSRHLLASAFLLVGSLSFGSQARAQVPTNIYEYSRTSSFTYDATTGLLKSETVEPDLVNSCVVTSYIYDAYGNKSTTQTSNCSGASGQALFATREAVVTYAPVTPPTVVINGKNVTLPKGAFPVISTNALDQTETKEFDPRFGVVTKLTGPNGLVTRWKIDDFGRVIEEKRADGTIVRFFHCSINPTTADTDGCSGKRGEAPDDAATFVHSDTVDNSGNVIGGYSRTYADRLGRTIRTAKQSFDGTTQEPAAIRGAAIVQDVVYNLYGQKVLETAPYFVATGSSTAVSSHDVGVTSTRYDALGRAIEVTEANAQGTAGSATFGAGGSTVSYGTYGTRRVAKTTYVYAGNTTTITNDKGQKRTEERNLDGELVRVTDATGAQLAHRRDAQGNLVVTKDALQNTTSITYDIRGRKVALSDPDTGTWRYGYNALGELTTQQSANQIAAGQQTSMTYDKLGRLIQRVEPEGKTTWSYDKYADGSGCGKGVGKLCEVKVARTRTDFFVRKHAYDALGRALTTRLIVNGGPTFANSVEYDAKGRVASSTYPTGLKLLHGYSGLGALSTLSLSQAVNITPWPSAPGGTSGVGKSLPANTVLWRAERVNAWGRVDRQALANGVSNAVTFDPMSGDVVAASAANATGGSVYQQSYVWDSLGNMTRRADITGDGANGAVTEDFVYGDSLSRLTKYTVAGLGISGGSRSVTLQYNALGMLLHKSDVGVYSYGPQGAGSVRPHALQTVTAGGVTSYAYDANGNMVSSTGGKYRQINYTSFNLPDSQAGIAGSSGGAHGGTAKYTWLYDDTRARIKEVRTITGGAMAGTRTTWNLHPDNVGGLGFEMEVNAPIAASAANPSQTMNRHYLSAGGQAIGVLVTTGPLAALSGTGPLASSSAIEARKLEYWHKDHLGSLVATTDHTGAVTARYAYDPFGKRRQSGGGYDSSGALVVDWSGGSSKGTDRGFTGHEHLDDVGLVHMNGRLFDPTLGLFMQADPLIQDSTNLQNFNRYGYCLNNPMTCTDPSGHSWLSRAWHFVWRTPVFRTAIIIGVSYWTAGYGGQYAASYASAGNAGVAYAAGAGATASFTSSMMSTGGDLGSSFQSGLLGGVTGAAFHFAGFGSSWASYAGHAGIGCVRAAVSGDNCGRGALAQLASKFASLELPDHILTEIVVGGTVSSLTGGKFANGAATAAYAYLVRGSFSSARSPTASAGSEDLCVDCSSVSGLMQVADNPEVTRHAAFADARRAAQIPGSAVPQVTYPQVYDGNVARPQFLYDKDGKPVLARQYTYEFSGRTVVIQEHSVGHMQKGPDGKWIIQERGHFNVRDVNGRTLPGAKLHYNFESRVDPMRYFWRRNGMMVPRGGDQ